jgi:hypothetical protein
LHQTEDRLNACLSDPRVVAGLVTKEICAGADIFFREKFNGNGRTCGSCHPVNNNTTLDAPFIQALHDSNPLDPLFVFETNPALAQLETTDLRNFATILESVARHQYLPHRPGAPEPGQTGARAGPGRDLLVGAPEPHLERHFPLPECARPVRLEHQLRARQGQPDVLSEA